MDIKKNSDDNIKYLTTFYKNYDYLTGMISAAAGIVSGVMLTLQLPINKNEDMTKSYERVYNGLGFYNHVYTIHEISTVLNCPIEDILEIVNKPEFEIFSKGHIKNFGKNSGYSNWLFTLRIFIGIITYIKSNEN